MKKLDLQGLQVPLADRIIRGPEMKIKKEERSGKEKLAE